MAQGDVITDFTPGVDVIQLSLSGIKGLDDLEITARDGGVAVGLGTHGVIFLQGDLTESAVAQYRKFVF